MAKLLSGTRIYGTATIDTQLLVNGTTQSTSTVTGAITVAGGVGIGKDLYVGGSGNFYSDSNFYSNISITGTSNLTNLTVSGSITSTNTTTASTSAGGQGALSLQGGAYVGKNLIVMSAASSTATGLSNALYVEGGAYIKDTFTVEGSVLFKNPVTFSGTATYVLSTNTVYTDNILHLHTPPEGIDAQWTLDDGKDIGIRFHYYSNTDTNAAFVFANDTKKFEFYKSGAEGTSTFTSGVYAGVIAGSLQLNDTTGTSNTSTGALIVAGGVGIADGIYVGANASVQTLTARSLTDTRLVIAGEGGHLYDYAGLTYNTSTNIIQGTITTASFATTASFVFNATTASNIAGGSLGALVYQTSTGATNFVDIGTATYVLTSNGMNPYWAPTSIATTATEVQATAQSTSATYYLTFVDSNNVIAAGELVYTTSSFSINPATSNITSNGDLSIGGNINVGSVTVDTTVSAITSNNLNLSSYTKTGITGSSSIDLDSYSGSNYRSSKYFIQVVDGTDVHVTEMSIFHNGTSAYKTEYGYHYSNGILGTFNAVYTASNVVLSFQPISATNMTIKVVRLSITP